MFKRTILYGVVALMLFVASAPLTHAEEVSAAQAEERAVLLSKLDSLLKLLTALQQLHLTQTASSLTAQLVPPQVLPSLPPPPTGFDEATN